MARKQRFDFDDQGPKPPVGEVRITDPVHVKQHKIVMSKTSRDWVHVVFADGPMKGESAGKMRRFLWNNLRRSHK